MDEAEVETEACDSEFDVLVELLFVELLVVELVVVDPPPKIDEIQSKRKN